jgi:hypothetical protein
MNGNWEDYPSDWLGCGVAEHGPECLCDVHIVKPTLTVTDWVNHVWMGRELCELRGYGKPWTGAMLADYLSDLGTFHAALKLHGMDKQTGSLGSSLLEDAGFAGMVNIRNAVRDMLERMTEPSLAKALEVLGVSPQRFLDAASQSKMENTDKWDIVKVAQFEQEIMSHKKIADMCTAFGISEGNYYTIKEYLRPVFAYHKVPFVWQASEERETARKRVIALIAEGYTNAEIIAKVDAECGVRYRTAAISKLRARKFGKKQS